MTPKICYLQGDCPFYSSGDNKPPNNHVRCTVPCMKHTDDSCKMITDIRLFFGETISCDISKQHKAIKELHNEKP